MADFEQLTNIAQIPELQDPGMVGLAVAGGVIGLAYIQQHFDRATEKAALDHRGNTETFRLSGIGVPENKGQRLAPVNKLILGGTAVGASLLGNPTYETTVPDTEAAVVVVSDVSSSMAFTKDLDGDVSRAQAAKEGLKVTEFPGILGLIEAGRTSQIVIAPAKDWSAKLETPAETPVEPNGDSLLASITQAASLLPKDVATGKPDGTIMVISDGTSADAPENFAAQAAELKEAGVKVQVIVPGTEGGTYQSPDTTETSKSAIQPQTFEAYGDNVTLASDREEVVEAVSGQLRSAGERTEKRDYPFILWGGIALAGYGVLQAAGRIINRRI